MLERFHTPAVREAGCDEAGRGCLAGPVVCAAVILPNDFNPEGINDSKKLSPRRREELRLRIEKEADAWCVVAVPPEEIDKINILQASIAGMHRAVDGLSIMPEHIIVDGNKFTPHPHIPHHCIVKGDAKYLSIAAASILAKTHRDQIMCGLAKQFPGYDWENNMGYPTKKHQQGLRRLGPTPMHRRSFRLEYPEK